MLPIACLLLAAVNVAFAAPRPRYGGVLRVQMQAWASKLDPAAAEDATALSRLTPLVFDRLVDVDARGLLEPALATSWQFDGKRWTFTLRPGVRFHDGSPLTPSEAAMSLAGYQSLISDTEVMVLSADPELPRKFAGMAFSIRKTGSGGSLIGTGPFHITSWTPDRSAVFAANENYWKGRPFLDGIQVEMGRPVRQQKLDMDLGRADVIDMAPEAWSQVRHTAASEPLELVALVFDKQTNADPRVREALAFSIDRQSIHAVIAQRAGVPASTLLPHWLTGYTHLFPVQRDIGRAQLKARETAETLPPVVLQSDPLDPMARLIAERISVNAREAHLTVRAPQPGGPAGCRLIRLRFPGEDSLSAATFLATAIGVDPPPSADAILDWERALVESYVVIPLLHLPEVFGLSPRVRNWRVLPWGGWSAGDVWLTEKGRP